MNICSVAIDVGELITMFNSVRKNEKGSPMTDLQSKYGWQPNRIKIMMGNDDNFALIKKQISVWQGEKCVYALCGG